jgi:hypothetical protein
MRCPRNESQGHQQQGLLFATHQEKGFRYCILPRKGEAVTALLIKKSKQKVRPSRWYKSLIAAAERVQNSPASEQK